MTMHEMSIRKPIIEWDHNNQKYYGNGSNSDEKSVPNKDFVFVLSLLSTKILKSL